MKNYWYLFISLFILNACGNGSKEEEEDFGITQSEITQKINTQNIFYSVPSPVEASDILEGTNAEYDPSLLNDPQNYSKYSTEFSKAVNLGIYGADLSYTSMFNQSQESMIFLKAVNALSKSLGINGAFDEKTAERIDINKENRDSLLSIISQSFWEADEFLKENQRPQVSSLIVSGGWLEGLYLASKLAVKTGDKKVYERVAEQKLSLENLVGMLEPLKLKGQDEELLDDLKSLKKVFEQVHFTNGETMVKNDDKQGLTTLSSSSVSDISKDKIVNIEKEVSRIRAKMIQIKR
jgi:hypothetical protein